MYIMIDVVLGFGIFSLLGYLVYSIINLNKIIENPGKTLSWGIMYILGATISDIFFKQVIPMFSKGDGASLFSAVVLCIVLLMFWIRSRELK